MKATFRIGTKFFNRQTFKAIVLLLTKMRRTCEVVRIVAGLCPLTTNGRRFLTMNKLKKIARKRYYLQLTGDVVAANNLSDNRTFKFNRHGKSSDVKAGDSLGARMDRAKAYIKKIFARKPEQKPPLFS